MTSSTIKNVALTAATGDVGSVIFRKLTASGLFNVRILSYSGSTSSFPPGTDVVKVDFSSVESLTAALNGQDAVISAAGNEGLPGQKLLIDAAIAAGVKRFLPSEYGGDLANHNARTIPPLRYKVETEEYLEIRSAESALLGRFTYTYVYTSAFLDWGLDIGLIMNINDTVPQAWGSGDLPFNGVVLDSVGDAVVGILKNPDQTANRPVYISNGVVTQNKLIQLVSELGLSEKESWKPELAQHHDIEDFATKAFKNLEAGVGFDSIGMMPFLVRSCYYPSYNNGKYGQDNTLLGIKKLSDEELKQYLKEAIIKLSTNPTQKR
ncbi:hypothetical protein E8E13_000396 [Curvularia kusanoi]|uniref:NmrA-like domain-containing protein n=1 Tax=Curvularia kusanoi TaxID=90978 RepID=A0A9P4T4D5_CURKU|nr:hypothetical protein E8E13_000396 [Curvularia kusanoi]